MNKNIFIRKNFYFSLFIQQWNICSTKLSIDKYKCIKNNFVDRYDLDTTYILYNCFTHNGCLCNISFCYFIRDRKKVFLDYSVLFSNQEDSYSKEYLFHKTKAMYWNKKILIQELQELQSFQLLSKKLSNFVFGIFS